MFCKPIKNTYKNPNLNRNLFWVRLSIYLYVNYFIANQTNNSMVPTVIELLEQLSEVGTVTTVTNAKILQDVSELRLSLAHSGNTVSDTEVYLLKMCIDDGLVCYACYDQENKYKKQKRCEHCKKVTYCKIY